MSKIANGGLDQYGDEPFKQQQFGTAGVKGVNLLILEQYVSRWGRAKRPIWGLSLATPLTP